MKAYVLFTYFHTAQKMKFSIRDFLSKCDQIRSFKWIWSRLLKKSLMESFIFCVASVTLTYLIGGGWRQGTKNSFWLLKIFYFIKWRFGVSVFYFIKWRFGVSVLQIASFT